MTARGNKELWSHQAELVQRIKKLGTGGRLAVDAPPGVGKTTAATRGLAQRWRAAQVPQLWLVLVDRREVGNQWLAALSDFHGMDARVVDPKWLRNWQLHAGPGEEPPPGVYIFTWGASTGEVGRRWLSHRSWDLVLSDGLPSSPQARGLLDSLTANAPAAILLADRLDAWITDDWDRVTWQPTDVPGRLSLSTILVSLTEEELRVRAALQELADAAEIHGGDQALIVDTWLQLASSSMFALDAAIRRAAANATDDLRPGGTMAPARPPVSDKQLRELIGLLEQVRVDTRMEAASRWIGDSSGRASLVVTDSRQTARGLAFLPDVEQFEPRLLASDSGMDGRDSDVPLVAEAEPRPVIAAFAEFRGAELRADRVLHVDLPFDPRRLWTRLVRVRSATSGVVAHYLLLEADQVSGSPLSFLEGEYEFGELQSLLRD